MTWTINRKRPATASEAPPSVEPYWDGDSLVHHTAELGLQPIATAANRRPVHPARAGRVGAGCVIGARAVVYAGVIMGRACRIGDGAVIRENVVMGDECVIGCMADLQYGVRLGDRVRILNEAQIAGGSSIGTGSFVGPGTQSANDRHIARFGLEDYRDRGQDGVTIGEYVFIGAGCLLLPGIRIGDRAVVAAGSLVTRDVAAGEKVMGRPARRVFVGGLLGDQPPEAIMPLVRRSDGKLGVAGQSVDGLTG